MITTYGVTRTGYKIKNVEDIAKLKNCSVVSSELMGNEYGPELRVCVKVGCKDRCPVVADYWISAGSYGSCSYFVAKDDDFNAYLIKESSDLPHSYQDDFEKTRIGRNGYAVLSKPVIHKYDEQKVKQSAFWCLENHYTKDLSEIFSIVKDVELMKMSPDEESCECDRELTREEETRIAQAGADFYIFPKYAKNREQESFQSLPAKQYLGYIIEADDTYGPARPLKNAEEVAQFVCNPDYIGNNKMVTNMLDQLVLSTYGCFVNRFADCVEEQEKNELLDAVKAIQLEQEYER